MSATLTSLRTWRDRTPDGTTYHADRTPVADVSLRTIARDQGQALRAAYRPAPATPAPGQAWVPQEILDGGRAAYPTLDALALQVPTGSYALRRAHTTAAGNDATFFEVTEAKKTGKHYIRQLLGAPGSFTTRTLNVREQYFALKHLIDDGDAAAVLFGQLTKTCSDCGSPLTNALSRSRGVGPKCWYKPRFAAVREAARTR
jgi:hypothetical protein